MPDEKSKLIDQVLQQISLDIAEGDVTAIEEMLMHLPVEILKGYLPEEKKNA